MSASQKVVRTLCVKQNLIWRTLSWFNQRDLEIPPTHPCPHTHTCGHFPLRETRFPCGFPSAIIVFSASSLKPSLSLYPLYSCHEFKLSSFHLYSLVFCGQSSQSAKNSSESTFKRRGRIWSLERWWERPLYGIKDSRGILCRTWCDQRSEYYIMFGF